MSFCWGFFFQQSERIQNTLWKRSLLAQSCILQTCVSFIFCSWSESIPKFPYSYNCNLKKGKLLIIKVSLPSDHKIFALFQNFLLWRHSLHWVVYRCLGLMYMKNDVSDNIYFFIQHCSIGALREKNGCPVFTKMHLYNKITNERKMPHFRIMIGGQVWKITFSVFDGHVFITQEE